MQEEGVLQPLLVTQSAITLATECVRMILKVGTSETQQQRCRSPALACSLAVCSEPS